MSRERLIVVATEDACGFDGKVSSQLGRSPFFLMAEADGRMATVSKVVPNPCSGAHRRGAVPRFVRDLGAIEIFERFGIEVATGVHGTVATVLGAYLSGEHRGVVPCAHDPSNRCREDGGQSKGDRHEQGCHQHRAERQGLGQPDG
jgi:predicted Fe-Mo cluster-binding NifX family protein